MTTGTRLNHIDPSSLQGESENIMRHCGWLYTILIALVWLAACSPTTAPLPASTAPPTTASTATAAATRPPAPTDAELRAAVIAAFRAQQTRAFRQTSDTVLADGTTHAAVVEFAPPDRYHILADAVTELIIVGETVYLKDKTTWSEPGIPVDSLIDRDFVDRLERSLSALHLAGSESVNGVSLQVIQYRSALKVGEAEVSGQSKVWINPSDQLPYRLVVDGQTTVLDNSTGKVTGVPAMTTIVYEYDPGLQIVAPK